MFADKKRNGFVKLLFLWFNEDRTEEPCLDLNDMTVEKSRIFLHLHNQPLGLLHGFAEKTII